VVDGNGVAIAAELMDEFFHLLAKIGRAAGEWATNCHFCRVDDGGWQRRCRGVIYRARAARERRNWQSFRRLSGAGEINFAPTSREEPFANEGYADGKKSVSLADAIPIWDSYPAHLAVYGVTSKSASLADATLRMGWLQRCRGVIHRARAARQRRK
jgi:hypothetical protein